MVIFYLAQNKILQYNIKIRYFMRIIMRILKHAAFSDTLSITAKRLWA